MSEGKDIVNIFLNTDQKHKEILDNASAEQKYIILQNDYLHVKNQALLVESIDIKNTNVELEEDNDRLEKRIINITGILKNFHVQNNLYKELSQQEKKIFDNYCKDFSNFQSKAKYHLRILESFLLAFIGVCYEYYDFKYFLPVLVVIMCIIAFQESTMFNMRQISYRKEDWVKINSLKNEIDNITKAQDYIHEFLDQL